MGFKSVLKKVGKVALKAAPFALDFIPGGQIAHLALAAGLGGVDAAAHHKGLKGILGGAAIGAGSFEGGHLLGKLGNSSKVFGGGGDVAKSFDAAPDISRTAFGGSKLASGGVRGALSSTGKYLAKNPMLALAAASMLGGDDSGGGGQKRQSYRGPLTNPEDSLYQALSGVYRAGQGMMEKKPVQLRGLLPEAPQPVSIPGLPFQIGGGMGHNPAQDDMEVDSMEGYRNYDPFQSIAQGQFGDAASKKKKTGL